MKVIIGLTWLLGISFAILGSVPFIVIGRYHTSSIFIGKVGVLKILPARGFQVTLLRNPQPQMTLTPFFSSIFFCVQDRGQGLTCFILFLSDACG